MKKKFFQAKKYLLLNQIAFQIKRNKKKNKLNLHILDGRRCFHVPLPENFASKTTSVNYHESFSAMNSNEIVMDVAWNSFRYRVH